MRAAVPWSIGRLLAVLTVPFLTANNELLLLLRWSPGMDDDRGCTTVCRAAVFAAVRAIIGTAERGLPLAAGVLVLCMVLQCIRLAARSEYIAED